MFDWANKPRELQDAFTKKQEALAKSPKHPGYINRIKNMTKHQKDLYYNHDYTPIFNKTQYKKAISLLHLSFRRYFCHDPLHPEKNISEAQGRNEWQYDWGRLIPYPDKFCDMANYIWLG